MSLLAILAAAALAFANGANDNAKGVATLVGAGTLSPLGNHATRGSRSRMARLVHPSALSHLNFRVRYGSEPWAPACGLVPALARWALTRAPGPGGAGSDNPKIKV